MQFVYRGYRWARWLSATFAVTSLILWVVGNPGPVQVTALVLSHVSLALLGLPLWGAAVSYKAAAESLAQRGYAQALMRANPELMNLPKKQSEVLQDALKEVMGDGESK